MFCLRKCLLWLGLALWWAAAAWADFAADLARVHVEAMGGREAIEALSAMKVTGSTRIADQELPFFLWVRRPNYVRIETVRDEVRLVRAFNGRQPPWRRDSADGPVLRLAPAEERDFVADSAFDNMLFDYANRGISLDYSGFVDLNGRRHHRLLATRNFTEQFWLYIDLSNFQLARRDAIRRARGREVVVETHYFDFKPVQGVMLPHRVQTKVAGELLHETVIDEIVPNPFIPPGFFDPPPPPPE